MEFFSISSVATLALAGSCFAQTRHAQRPVLEPNIGLSRSVSDDAARFAAPFPVAGIQSGDPRGAPINQVFFINFGAGVALNGIGWDVDLEAFETSWRSEIGVSITNSSCLGGFSLHPGTDNSPGGPTNYNSGGQILYLANYNIPDVVALGDGLIRFEFFESYDDAPGAFDGQWVSGQLFFPIPAAGSTSLLAAAGMLLLRRKQR